MSWLQKFLSSGERPDPEMQRETQELKLERYRLLKRFAREQGDEDLYDLAKRKEELMVQMLQDEYDVIASGAELEDLGDE